jgi:hypothetical protein
MSRLNRGATFADAIKKIQNYAIRNDGDDWKRSLVCGLVWLAPHGDTPGAFATSTAQLCALLNKCKSSINICFQAMVYGVAPLSLSHASEFIKIAPGMRSCTAEMRAWTIRLRTPASASEKPEKPGKDEVDSLELLIPDLLKPLQNECDAFGEWYGFW